MQDTTPSQVGKLNQISIFDHKLTKRVNHNHQDWHLRMKLVKNSEERLTLVMLLGHWKLHTRDCRENCKIDQKMNSVSNQITKTQKTKNKSKRKQLYLKIYLK